MPTKDEDLYTTQYDGHFVEAIGLLKMDFLGLKTLSIIRETLDNVKRSKGITIDIDKIPMDDERTLNCSVAEIPLPFSSLSRRNEKAPS
jgi:DNA polymerase-3 subunit alpha